MIFKLSCSDGQSLLIDIPSGKKIEPGNTVKCPSNCPKRKICKLRAKKGEFSVPKRATPVRSGSAPSYEYRDGVWVEISPASDAPTAASVARTAAPAAVTGVSARAGAAARATSVSGTPSPSPESSARGTSSPSPERAARGAASAASPRGAASAAVGSSHARTTVTAPAEPAPSASAAEPRRPSWASGLGTGVRIGGLGTDRSRTADTHTPSVSASVTDGIRGGAPERARTTASVPEREASAAATSVPTARDARTSSARDSLGGALGGVTKSSYSYVSIGGETYSSTYQRGIVCKPLRRALDDIFSHWNTTFAFKGRKELRPEFKWLLLQTLDSFRIAESNELLGKILATTYSSNAKMDRSIKFFLIYRAVVNKDDPGARFYFSDEEDTRGAILPKFENRDDFVRKFFGDKPINELFRSFYLSCKLPVLYYFGRLDIDDITGTSDVTRTVVSADKRFLEDMSAVYMQITGCLVSVSYTGMNISVTNYGSADNFVNAMCKMQSIEKMDSMVSALETYRINSDHSIVRRAEGDRFTLSDKEAGSSESEIIYSYLGLPSSEALRAYNLYVSLIREYIDVFEPSSVSVGGIAISRTGLLATLHTLTRDICKYAYGENNDPGRCDEARARAYLLKSLLDRGILDYYKRSCESTKLNRYLKLIASQDDVGEFFDLFGSDAKIMMDNRELTVGQYIYELISRYPIDTLIEMFSDNDFLKRYLSDVRGSRVDPLINQAERIFSETFS